jgi:hypothetical protein
LKLGRTLSAAIEWMGYTKNPTCTCDYLSRRLDKEPGQMLVCRSKRRTLLNFMHREARRRGIIPAGTPIGWWPLIHYGIRDRLRAAWKAIKARQLA